MGRGAHYGPTPLDMELPRKRRRVDDSYRPGYSGGPVYQDHRTDVTQPTRDDTSRMRNDHHKNSGPGTSKTGRDVDLTSPRQSPDKRSTSAHQSQAGPKNPKPKRVRKENPSSRIHSLRKQLDRGGLPPTIKRERERELAALVFEQEKKKIIGTRKKNLERYHFVRFLERKKATREIRKYKNLKRNLGKKKSSTDLDQKLHEAEVDLMYTQYAPLGEKYISLYTSTEQSTGKEGASSEDLALLDTDQRLALQTANGERERSARTVIRASGHKTEDGTLMKPPRWYDVEAAMKADDFNTLKALRDGKIAKSQDLVLGLISKNEKAGEKRKADWLDDDGVIDPADLDSDSEADTQDGGVNLKDADDDDDVSDGDGGFFERH